MNSGSVVLTHITDVQINDLRCCRCLRNVRMSHRGIVCNGCNNLVENCVCDIAVLAQLPKDIKG